MHKLRFVAVIAVPLALAACSGAGDAGLTADEIGADRSAIAQGTSEPDYRYPWVVHFAYSGCGGVLITPQWVLTAAHCVSKTGTALMYQRTDPYTGQVHSAQFAVDSRGVFVHPQYRTGSFANDVALLRLSAPLPIDPYVQTVGLPTTPKVAGTIATLASVSHTATLPPGYVAIFRGPLPATSGDEFSIAGADAGASLCPGDSGSGLITYENGRAVVRGVAANAENCAFAGSAAGFMDVYAYRSWILKTMNVKDAELAGNTRVRWAGRAGRGVLGLGCTNPYGTMWAPLDVLGVQLTASCAGNETESVVCTLEPGQGLVINSLTAKTTFADGSTTTQSMPVSPTAASYYGLLPTGAVRELTCSIGLDYAAPVNPDTITIK